MRREPARPEEPGRARLLDPARVSGLRDHLRVFLLAALVGVGAGLAAIGFQQLTDLARGAYFAIFHVESSTLLHSAEQLVWWQRLVLPAIGAAVAALLLFAVFRRKGSYGVANIMETVSLRRGEVKLADVLARGVSTASVIGSGGSTGREGPIIQIGAALASLTGRATRLKPRDLSVLVACGAAAGMAGAYNAPIGAAMFVMEVILGSFVMEQFAPVMVASVTSTLTVRAISDKTVYDVPTLAVGSPWEAVPIFFLGILAALVGWGFLRSLTWTEDALTKLHLPRGMRAILGGLVVGALGIVAPEVWGNGYDAVSEKILKVAVGADMLLLLLVAKVAATAVTSGSGISGGVFTPTLFVGGALGAVYGLVLSKLFPGVDPQLFALIGMGSTLAATTHAPLMSILILFEMTHDPALIAPLMLGGVTATLFARFIHADSLYTARLKRRGVRLPEGAEEAALLRTYARDLVRTDAPVLAAHSPLDHVLDSFLNSRSDALYVVADGGRYVGVARIHDVKSAFASRPDGAAVIALDVAEPVPPITEDEAIGAALARFQDCELDEVPVVAAGEDKRFVGSLSRRDILAMLRHEVLVEPSRPARIGTRSAAGPAYLDLPPGWRLVEIPVPYALAGLPLDVDAWRRDRGTMPLVVLRADGAGSRTPTPPDGLSLRTSDVIVALGPSAPSPAETGQ